MIIIDMRSVRTEDGRVVYEAKPEGKQRRVFDPNTVEATYVQRALTSKEVAEIFSLGPMHVDHDHYRFKSDDIAAAQMLADLVAKRGPR